MSITSILKWTIVGVAALALSSQVVAQDPNARVTIGSGGAPAGGEVTIEWSYENFDDEVSSYSYVIEFDQTMLEPEVTGGNRDVVGCLDNLPEDWDGTNTTCRNVADSGEIVVVIAEDSGEPFGDFLIFPTTEPVGFITFTIDATATVGTEFDLEGVITTATDSSLGDVSGDFEIVDGVIEVLDLIAILNVDPDELDFGTQQTLTESGPLGFTISNDTEDGISLDVTDIVIGGANAGDFELAAAGSGNDCSTTFPFTLEENESCVQGVTFEPGVDGARSGQIEVQSDAGEQDNRFVDLLGEGIPTDASLVINPDEFDFGELDIDDDPVCENFTLLNDNAPDGTNSLTIGTVSIAAPFSVSDNCDDEELGPGGSCIVEVCFDPDEEAVFAETLTATSDVNEASADIDGVGTAAPDVSVDPDFGPVDLGVGEPGEIITANGLVTNDGSADADLSCTAAGDTDVITTDPDPLAATIPANDSVPFSISCALPEEGEEGDEFSITLSCDLDGEFAGEHVITCGISTFEPLPVPTMQTWALALFALLMLLAGGIGVRYFRAD